MLVLRPEYPTSNSTYTHAPFNWYLCSRREYHPKGFYILKIPVSTKLYAAKTGVVYQPSNEIVLFLLSEVKNKRRILSDGFKIDCDSGKNILSTECGLTTNPNHLRDAASFVIKKYKGLQGIAVRHDSFLPKDTECINHSLTFVIPKTKLTPFGGCDGRTAIIRYAKRHNSDIKKVHKDFPGLKEIDLAIQQGDCPRLAKSLYSIIYMYMDEKE